MVKFAYRTKCLPDGLRIESLDVGKPEPRFYLKTSTGYVFLSDKGHAETCKRIQEE